MLTNTPQKLYDYAKKEVYNRGGNGMYASRHFKPIHIQRRNLTMDQVEACGCSTAVKAKRHDIPLGANTFWGIPFDCGEQLIYVNDGSFTINFAPTAANYLVFLHASETSAAVPAQDGIYRPCRGQTPLMEPVCDYVIRYDDGETVTVPIRARMEVNDMAIAWGQGSFLCVPHVRGRAISTATDSFYAGEMPGAEWGRSQTRVIADGNDGGLQHWLFAFVNPRPDTAIIGIDVVKKNAAIFIFGITAGDVQDHPLRYGRRRKASFTLCGSAKKESPELVDIDLGHIISVTSRPFYDNDGWEDGHIVNQPGQKEDAYIVEFDAHADAVLYLGDERRALRVCEIAEFPDVHVKPAEIPVELTVCDERGKPVPVRVHAHGAAGEYLPPRNRHRIPNPYWFEDYSVDFVYDRHWCTYIDGTAKYLLPPGEVFFEVSKGFEIKPVRRRFVIDPGTRKLTITVERLIDWRSKGWVTADTHVHFLSPQSALLEGEAEDVNVVNLLASQWGELFTNIGDFTGAGETENGDYVVRVGTENRQRIMGHISLVGYDGAMILPLTTSGPDESALGDPMEITLTQWAAQCRAQKGLNILPHFPNPRAENAAAIVSELIDGVESTCWGELHAGINPYYLSDWYRYLNCGYHVAAVGGTDKMSAGTAVGAMRTYTKLDGPFTYQAWKDAVAAGKTFVTSSALIDMRIEGHQIGDTLHLASGGTLNIVWDIASVTIPITAVELVMNGETRGSARFDGLLGEKSGFFSVHANESAWFALRVRGRMEGKPELITAHTSAVFVIVDGKPLMNGPDAATILDQIEGATAYVKTLATKARESQFKLALAALAGAHRALHNRMHASGHFHQHSPEDIHPGH